MTCTFTFLVQDLLASHAARRTKYSLAVLTLSHADDSVSQVLTGRVTDALQRTGYFATMAYANMVARLRVGKVPAFPCATSRCGVQAGRVLGVQLVVVGRIAFTGGRHLINLQLVHVGSGKVVKQVHQKFEGSLRDLTAAVESAARMLVSSRERSARATRRPATPAADSGKAIHTDRRNAYVIEHHGPNWSHLGLGILIAGGIGAGFLLMSKKKN